MEYKILDNGVEMPMLGLGVYQMPPEDTERCVAHEAWAPFAEGQNDIFRNVLLAGIAEKHGKTPAQVSLRAFIQSDVVVIPKTVHRARMEENIDVFDFELDADDLAAFTTLDDPAFPRIFDHFDVGTVRWMLEELVRTQQLGGAPLY